MIYSYHCVDCGNVLQGEEISFDLGQMIGINPSDFSLPSTALLISSKKMQELQTMQERQMMQEQQLMQEQQVVRDLQMNQDGHGYDPRYVQVKLSLRRFIYILVSNMARRQNPNAYVDEELRGWGKDNLQDNLLNEVFDTGENAEVGEKMAADFVAAIEAHFVLTGEAGAFIAINDGDERISNILNSLANYETVFYVEPEYFGDGREGKTDKLYTVRYTSNGYAAAPSSMRKYLGSRKYSPEIRGFCPRCGSPVVDGAGKYQHILIGLLGVQSAGKTTLITALERNLQRNCGQYKVQRYPTLQLLCDERYEEMKRNFLLYDCGYAVNKTDISNAATFNASVQIWPQGDRQESKRKLVTFADIAGECCYDEENRMVKPDAFQTYPLIKSCDIYLLCTSINRRAYGNANNAAPGIPAAAPIAIAQELYITLANERGQRGVMPPLGIIFTKLDAVGNVANLRDAACPVDNLTVNREYQLRSFLDDIRIQYLGAQGADRADIQEPIEMACDLCNTMKDQTYIAMMRCSALGRTADPYPEKSATDDEIQENRNPPFETNNDITKLDDVWKWLLGVMGIFPQRSEGIPNWNRRLSVGQGYKIADKDVLAHRNLFMNQSAIDQKVHKVATDDVGVLPLRQKFFESEESCRQRNFDALCR